MKIEIHGTDFWIDGRPTYEGRSYQGHRVEGLLMNSRMVQALFDDENPETRSRWAYPDTGEWDPDRNTYEFCRALPEYRSHGLLAVTVGMQGGGSIYSPDVYDHYLNSAFRPDGSLKPPYAARLRQVLDAADRADMAVIVNPFYWRQERFESDEAIRRAVDETMVFLLDGGWQNVLIDLKNEVTAGESLLQTPRIEGLLRRMHAMRGDRCPPWIGCSTMPGQNLQPGGWQDLVEFWMPHGNDSPPEKLGGEIEEIRNSPSNQANPRPIMVNEDSVHVENLLASLEHSASWGYYDQGYGCVGTHGRFDWTVRGREERYEDLSGFQTVPVNWSVNTDHKRAFFGLVKEVTGG